MSDLFIDDDGHLNTFFMFSVFAIQIGWEFPKSESSASFLISKSIFKTCLLYSKASGAAKPQLPHSAYTDFQPKVQFPPSSSLSTEHQDTTEPSCHLPAASEFPGPWVSFPSAAPPERPSPPTFPPVLCSGSVLLAILKYKSSKTRKLWVLFLFFVILVPKFKLLQNLT